MSHKAWRSILTRSRIYIGSRKLKEYCASFFTLLLAMRTSIVFPCHVRCAEPRRGLFNSRRSIILQYITRCYIMLYPFLRSPERQNARLLCHPWKLWAQRCWLDYLQLGPYEPSSKLVTQAFPEARALHCCDVWCLRLLGSSLIDFGCACQSHHSPSYFVVSSQILEKARQARWPARVLLAGVAILFSLRPWDVLCLLGLLEPTFLLSCPLPGPSRDCECLCRDALTVFTQFHSTASIQTRLLFGLRLNVCSWACLCQGATHCLGRGSRHQNCG